MKTSPCGIKLADVDARRGRRSASRIGSSSSCCRTCSVAVRLGLGHRPSLSMLIRAGVAGSDGDRSAAGRGVHPPAGRGSRRRPMTSIMSKTLGSPCVRPGPPAKAAAILPRPTAVCLGNRRRRSPRVLARSQLAFCRLRRQFRQYTTGYRIEATCAAWSSGAKRPSGQDKMSLFKQFRKCLGAVLEAVAAPATARLAAPASAAGRRSRRDMPRISGSSCGIRMAAIC